MHPRKITSAHCRIYAVVIIASFAALFATACDDFYTDSLPTPDIAQPTPANVIDGIPEEILEIAAREAMAEKLGIDPSAPRKILFEHETWTERNPGCYPQSESLTGAYLIPGYRLLLQHDGIFYEYDADSGAGTGALCESTFQFVPAELAYSIVAPSSGAVPEFDTIHVIRSDDDVLDFNSTKSDIAEIGVDEIDFPEEVLVGGWVELSPNPDIIRAYLSSEGTSIIIELAIPEDSEDEATDTPSQIWALVDTTDADSTYEFLVVD
jgi:hypothetical protein